MVIVTVYPALLYETWISSISAHVIVACGEFYVLSLDLSFMGLELVQKNYRLVSFSYTHLNPPFTPRPPS